MPPVDRNRQQLHEFEQALQLRIGQRRFKQWFGTTAQFLLNGDQLVLEVASPYLLNWIERQYLADLRETASSILGPQYRVHCQVAAAPVVLVQPVAADVAAGEQPVVASVARITPADKRESTRTGRGRRLARLGDFVTGSSNELARAAAEQILSHPGETPLVYFQANVGNGKTHLLEGLLREIKKGGTGGQPMLLGAEQFTNYFTQAMSSRTTPSFRARFQAVDVLLLDDVDFLDGKRGTQDELLHVIKQIQSKGGQLIVSGNCHPRLLTKTSEELVSRFQAGLVCRIEAPDEAVRRQIVIRHAERQRVTLSRGTIEFLVERFIRNVRELEGAVNVLATWSRMSGKRVGTTAARELLGRLERDCLKIIRVSDVEQAVCDLFGVTQDGLRGNSRKQNVTQPRMLAMYLARRLANVPYSEIGEHFGRRNHSTVMSAERKVQQQLQSGTEVQLGTERWSMQDLLKNLEERVRAS